MYYNYKESAEILNFLHENCIGDALRLDALNEEAQPAILAGTLNKMLDLTISRYSKIDFTDIEKSHGNPIDCKFYKNLKESIDLLMDIDETTHKIPTVTVVSTALNNLVMLKDVFKNAFRTKNSLGIMLYNMTYYAVMEATSYIIATSVDFVRDGDKMVVEARELNGRDVTIISNLEKFNKEVASGNVEKFVKLSDEFKDTNLDDDGTLHEGVVGDAVVKLIGNNWAKLKEFLGTHKRGFAIGAGVLALLYVMINIIPLIRGCAYVIYKFKHKLSEAARVQAEMLELNIQILKEQGADEKTIEKQEKAAAMFRKLADAFALEYDKAQNEAKKDEKQDPVDANAVVI